jgi:hypothetical protein
LLLVLGVIVGGGGGGGSRSGGAGSGITLFGFFVTAFFQTTTEGWSSSNLVNTKSNASEDKRAVPFNKPSRW